MSDLVAFLRAQYDADEAAARAAYDEAGDYRVVGSELAELHFVRWKPDRVLADVAAKRAILEMHPGSSDRDECPGCGADLMGRWETGPGEQCEVLLLLAQPFEGLPGWDDAWKVER